MSDKLGYIYAIKGTNYHSLQIGVGGPTIYQSNVAPDIANAGDIFIETGDTPSFQQFMSGSWSPIAGGGSPVDVDAAISNSIETGDIGDALAASNDMANAAASVVDVTYLHVSNEVPGTYTPNGSPAKPFTTIQSAHDWANTHVINGHVVINVHAGNYTGATIRRPRTSIKGAATGTSGATNLSTGLVIDPAIQTGGNLFATQINLQDLQINTTTTGSPITVQGSVDFMLLMSGLKALTTTTGASALTMAGGQQVKLNVFDCEFNNEGSNATTLDMGNLYAGSNLSRVTVYANDGTAIRLRSGTVNCDLIFTGSTHDNVVMVDSGLFNITRSTMYNLKPNSNGMVIATGATAVCFNNFFNVLTGNGFAIAGSAGGVLVHASNVYYANNKISSAMGGGIIAMSTSPVTV